MKHKVNSQRKLFWRLTAVLVAVLAFSRVSADDGKVFAGVDTGFLSGTVSIAELFSSDKEDDKKVAKVTPKENRPDIITANEDPLSEDIDPYGVIPGLTEEFVTDDLTETDEDEVVNADFPDPEAPLLIAETIADGTDVSDEPTDPVPTQAPVPTATPTPTPVPVKDMSVMTEQELAEYKTTISYPYSLAVTSPIYGDPEFVKNVAVPTQSADDRYMHVTGAGAADYTMSRKAVGYENYTAAFSQMTQIDVPVWKLADSGIKYESYVTLTVNRALADSIRCIFSDIFLLNIRFPVSEVIGFEYRKVSGAGLSMLTNMSAHSFGAAIDLNPGDYDNDLYVGKGNDLRDKKGPYYIPAEVIKIFKDYGWYWGGDFEICTDTPHFQYFDDSYLRYGADDPFPVLKKGAKDMDAEVIRNLTGRLTRLGYLQEAVTSYNNKVITAVKSFQKANGLSATGTVSFDTWVKLINLTHDMGYVF